MRNIKAPAYIMVVEHKVWMSNMVSVYIKGCTKEDIMHAITMDERAYAHALTHKAPTMGASEVGW